MLLKKQTVWLLSMLTIMVVLSAYYLLQGPVEQVPVVTDEEGHEVQVDANTNQVGTDSTDPAGTGMNGTDVNTDQATLPGGIPFVPAIPGVTNTGGNSNATDGTAAVDPTTVLPQASGDFFITYRMNRDAWESKRLEELMSVMSDTQASATAITEAKNEVEKLTSLRDAERTVEELIKANGYKEALVVAKDDRVDVIVQVDTLNKQQAVEIISMVTRYINVPGKNVVISYKR